MVAGVRYGAISNNDKTIAIVTFSSIDATGADEGSSGPILARTEPSNGSMKDKLDMAGWDEAFPPNANEHNANRS
ncbi:hypothetical protein ACMDCR_03900 [Labrys okinawensis]|uniref:hypothetical protein n=1 Tax=Labrys okinawensis TaxID=346911 RepID=UPI0039BC34E9